MFRFRAAESQGLIVVAWLLILPIPAMRVSADLDFLVLPEGQIAYELDGDIWIATLVGGQGLRITTDGNNFSPAWSPDGNSLLYQHGDPRGTAGGSRSQLEVRILDIADLSLRLALPSACCAAWSPSGDELAVFSYDSYAFEIVSADGSARRLMCCDNYLGTAPYDAPSSGMVWTGGNVLYSPAGMLGYINLWDLDSNRRSTYAGTNIPWMRSVSGVCLSDPSVAGLSGPVAYTVQGGSSADFPCTSLVGDPHVGVLDSRGQWRDLGPGSDPSWSPSGQWLAVEGVGSCDPGAAGSSAICRGGISVVSLDDLSLSSAIEAGSDPAWRPISEPLPFPDTQPVPSVDDEAFAELLSAKRGTIDYLSNPDFGSIGLPALRGEGYDESRGLALVNDVESMFAEGRLGPSLASGFLRLKLQEDVLRESFVAYLITVDDLNDTTVSLFDIVLDVITVARSVTEPVDRLGEEILEKIVEKLSDLLNDWIQAHEGISPIWRTAATVILDQMEGDIDVASVGAEAFRLELDQRLTSDYVQRTQPILDRAVTSAADPSTFSGSDDAQAVHEVDQRLATLREDIDRRHEILTWAKDFLDDFVFAFYPLAPTAPGQLVIAVNELIAVITELHLQADASLKSVRDIQSVLGDSQRLLFPHADVSALVDGPPSVPQVEPRPLAAPGDLYMLASARLPDRASGGTLHADLTGQQAIEGYQQVLQELMRAIGEGDPSTVEDLVPRLSSNERNLAAEFRKTRARAIAEGDAEMAAAIYRAAAEYDLRTVSLYFALGTYLSGAEGAEINGPAQTQAEAVLQAIERYAQEISTAKSRLATLPAGPIVVASAVEVTSSVRVDRPVSMKLTLANASELIADDVTVRIFIHDQTEAHEEIVGTLAGNEEATLDVELDVESRTDAMLVQVYSGDKLTDSRLILLADPTLEDGGGAALPTTNLAAAAIVLVCVVTVVLCLGGATVWLLRRRA